MALKIVLKPGEKVIIGGAVVTNGSQRAEFLLENKVPVLRQKDILTPGNAWSPCERLYLMVQLMYIDPQNAPGYHQPYWQLTGEVLRAAPSTLTFIEPINSCILKDEHYQALKIGRRLIRYERELLSHVRE